MKNFSPASLPAIFCLAAGLVLPGDAAEYFVSAGEGKDSNDGSLSRPFATIGKAAGTMGQGDTCLIRAGVYRETVVPLRPYCTFQSYGNETVIINGADEVPGPWSVYRGRIYSTAVELSQDYSNAMLDDTTLLANQLFLDTVMLIEARFPNTEGDNAARPRFASWSTPLPGGLTGAVRMMGGWFNNSTARCRNDDCSSFEWDQSGDPFPCVGGRRERHWASGALSLLDAAGEWHYDPREKALYLWMPDSGPPSPGVLAKKRNFAFDLRGIAGTSIRGISIFAATIITDSFSTHTVLDRLNARYVSHHATTGLAPVTGGDACNGVASHTDDTGIMLYGDSSMIINSVVRGSSGNGILCAAEYIAVFNCHISDCNYMASYASLVHVLKCPVRVLHNTIHGAGREAVAWDWHRAEGGSGGVLRDSEFAYNHFHSLARLNGDIGAIYICCGIQARTTTFHHNWYQDGMDPYTDNAGFGAIPVLYFDNGSYNACTRDNDGFVKFCCGGNRFDNACENNTLQHTEFDMSPGCNFEGCTREAVGQQLPSYDNIPDLDSIPGLPPIDVLSFLQDGKALWSVSAVGAGSIEIRTPELSPVAVRLVTANGRTVAHEVFQGKNRYMFETGKSSAGFYILEIRRQYSSSPAIVKKILFTEIACGR